MSYGDELMASGHALSEHERTGLKVVITDRSGRARWDDLWAGLPWIVQPGEPAAGAARVTNGPQCRPYIRYPFTRDTGCTFSGWRARDHVGALSLTAAELAAGRAVRDRLGHFTLVEPHVPAQSNPNKQWGWARWQVLADLLRASGRRVAQFSLPGVALLNGVEPIDTASFREGAAVLTFADEAVLPEGGMHHAAAVLRHPRTVVLFGGAVDPEATGYPWQVNLADAGKSSPCGKWRPCRHCAEVWARLDPAAVMAALEAA
ncbi:MAG: hypothetical protein U0942_15865 [Parvibaculum sp.]|uniref:hypothetical protein n=1 Tax=Parvibaculum sp. TaxID=2024848 RepID=UPI002AB9950F|nr:hypothetical protein [Parvibaculum sp.]MDZ4382808.1 hypothetical protein [Parvibaculum sp.]